MDDEDVKKLDMVIESIDDTLKDLSDTAEAFYSGNDDPLVQRLRKIEHLAWMSASVLRNDLIQQKPMA